MKFNLKKDLKKKTAYAVILLSVATLGIVGGNTYSKYYTQIDGTGNAEVAKWSFKANNQNTTIENIKLSNVNNVSKLKDKTIAPGTNGSFDIILDATGADVAIDYAVTFDNLVNKPTNLKFTYDNTTVSSLKDLESLLKGRILLSDSRTKTLKIEWSWDYQTGTTEEEKANNDKIDTAEAGKDFSFDILITGTQVNPKESGKKMKRYIFIFIIISFIILSLIFIINNKEIIQEQLPIRLLIIKSNSMYPTLEINDIVIIRKANIYNINDIITYSEGNKTLITHRIIDVVDTGVITKGDNNNIEDGKIIEFQNIKGKTIFIINKKYQKIMMILFILLLIFVFFYKI